MGKSRPVMCSFKLNDEEQLVYCMGDSMNKAVSFEKTTFRLNKDP